MGAYSLGQIVGVILVVLIIGGAIVYKIAAGKK